MDFRKDDYYSIEQSYMEFLHSSLGVGYEYTVDDLRSDADSSLHALDDLIQMLIQAGNLMDLREEYQDYQRYVRKEGRGRIIGGGFGLTNAIEGMAIAGAANMGIGAIHSIFNGIGSLMDNIKRSRDEANLYKQVRKGIYGIVYLDFLNMFYLMYEIAGIEFFYSQEKTERAMKLLRSMNRGEIPQEDGPQEMVRILYYAPHEKKFFDAAGHMLGYTKELYRYAEYMGQDDFCHNLKRSVSMAKNSGSIFGEKTPEMMKRYGKDRGFLYFVEHPDKSIITGISDMLGSMDYEVRDKITYYMMFPFPSAGEIHFTHEYTADVEPDEKILTFIWSAQKPDYGLTFTDKAFYIYFKGKTQRYEYDPSWKFTVVYLRSSDDGSLRWNDKGLLLMRYMTKESCEAMEYLIHYILLRIYYGPKPILSPKIKIIRNPSKTRDQKSLPSLAGHVLGIARGDAFRKFYVDKLGAEEAARVYLEHYNETPGEKVQRLLFTENKWAIGPQSYIHTEKNPGSLQYGIDQENEYFKANFHFASGEVVHATFGSDKWPNRNMYMTNKCIYLLHHEEKKGFFSSSTVAKIDRVSYRDINDVKMSHGKSNHVTRIYFNGEEVVSSNGMDDERDANLAFQVFVLVIMCFKDNV